MRSSLNELPVFALSIWGGMIAGLSASLIRLPRALYLRGLRGRRASPFLLVLFGALDIAAAAAAAAVFCLTLLKANGGELRLYAVCGYLAGAAVPCAAAALLLKKE